jgi:hypothetical protein
VIQDGRGIGHDEVHHGEKCVVSGHSAIYLATLSSAMTTRVFAATLREQGSGRGGTAPHSSFCCLPRTYVPSTSSGQALGHYAAARRLDFRGPTVRLTGKATLTRLLRSLGRQCCHNSDVLQQVLGQAVALL